ncbi:MAG: enoyl-CoA hydratase-related protein [Gemmatimonadetes bacterium]|nr:enoyl-CoA hydratase-related protein [Gemmatimonadota bacterium]
MSESGYQRITVVAEAGVATVTLNRPGKRNALDALMLRELRSAIAGCDADRTVVVLLLRGAGKDFCAGADLEQLERVAAGAGPLENLEDAMALGRLFIEMRRASKPIVAAVHGHALAGGAGLATAADLIIAADNAVFGYPEVHLGFVPAMVTAMLRRAVGEKVAFERTVLGDRFDAAEAARIGLVSRMFPAASFDEDSLAFARDIAKRPPAAMALAKRVLYGTEGLSFEDAIAHGAEVNALARGTEECREGVRAFLAKHARS